MIVVKLREGVEKIFFIDEVAVDVILEFLSNPVDKDFEWLRIVGWNISHDMNLYILENR